MKYWINLAILVRCLLAALIIVVGLIFVQPTPVSAASISDYFSFNYSVEFSKTRVKHGEVFYATVNGQASCTNDLPVTPSEVTATGRIVAVHEVSGAKVTLNPGYTVTLKPFPSRKGETVQDSQTVNLQFPPGSADGVYHIAAELIEAKLKAVVWFDVSSYLPPSKDAGSITYLTDNTGEIVPGPVPVATPNPSPGITDISDYVDATGVFKRPAVVRSVDGRCQLTINSGTKLTGANGSLLGNISILPAEKTLAAVSDLHIIGPVYNLGPDGATFNTPASLTLLYNDSQLPSGIAENNLVLAYRDKTADRWVELESKVNSEVNTVSVEITHFTMFAVLVHASPAKFSVTQLSVSPGKVAIGEKITVSILMTNSGDLSDTFRATLKIDGIPVGNKEINLEGHETGELVLSTIAETLGMHSIEMAGLTGIFEVGMAPSFSVNNLKIIPQEANVGENITVSIQVSNMDSFAGSYLVNLKINGLEVGGKKVTLDGGESQVVSFVTAIDRAGVYSIDVNGLIESTTVKEKGIISIIETVSRNHWWLASGLLAGVIVIVLILIKTRRRQFGK